MLEIRVARRGNLDLAAGGVLRPRGHYMYGFITTSFGPRKMTPSGLFGHATLLHVYTTSRGR
eukprot:6259772-Prymnesium_polylepis.1